MNSEGWREYLKLVVEAVKMAEKRGNANTICKNCGKIMLHCSCKGGDK